MPLVFERVRLQVDDLELAADLTLPDGAVVGVTGSDPAELQLFVELAAGAVSPTEGAVRRESFFLASATFHSADSEAISWWVEAAVQSEAKVVAIGPGLSLTPPGFRVEALRLLQRLAREGRLVLLVSQDLDLLERHCDEVVVFEDGAVAERGDPGATIAAFRGRIAAELRAAAGEAELADEPARHGDGRAELVALDLLGESGASTAVLRSGERAEAVVRVRFEQAVAEPVVGILLRNRVGVAVYGTNTELETLSFGPCASGDEVELRFAFTCDLCPQEYSLTAASHDPDGTAHDWIEEALLFSVVDARYTAGVANLRARVSATRM